MEYVHLHNVSTAYSLDWNVCPEEKITEVDCPGRRPEFFLVTDLLEVGQYVIPQTLVHSHEDT